MTIDGSSSTTTRLLTLLNVSATKANKRKRVYIEENQPTEKLNKKRATQFSLEADVIPSSLEADASKEADAPADLADEPEEEAEDTFGESPLQYTFYHRYKRTRQDTSSDPYETHFGLTPSSLSEHARDAVDRKEWTTRREKCGKLGAVVQSVLEGAEYASADASKHKVRVSLFKPNSLYVPYVM